MAKDVEINIKAVMSERWAPYFLGMLKDMESFGNRGHSGVIGFYADGDGDFRPHFTFKPDFIWPKRISRWEDDISRECEILYDAG